METLPQQSFSQAYASSIMEKTGVKPKIYQLGISKVYLKGHPKEGQQTHFKHKIEAAIASCVPTDKGGLMPTGLGKIHTCRPNYEYWKRIEEKVNSGYGVLSLCQWEGKPYNSARPAFMVLTRMHVDHLLVKTKGFGKGSAAVQLFFNGADYTGRLDEFAVNDGLEDGLDLVHWLGWEGFEGALINFTSFRYDAI